MNITIPITDMTIVRAIFDICEPTPERLKYIESLRTVSYRSWVKQQFEKKYNCKIIKNTHSNKEYVEFNNDKTYTWIMIKYG